MAKRDGMELVFPMAHKKWIQLEVLPGALNTG
jgi:hypothetical protein